MLAVHDHRDPSDADWDAYAAAYREGAREHGVRGLLAVSRGGGPNAHQRKRVLAAVGEHTYIKTAVCSSSAIARGITTAIGWLTSAQLRGFDYDERDVALGWLGVEPRERGAILAKVQEMVDDLDVSRRAR